MDAPLKSIMSFSDGHIWYLCEDASLQICHLNLYQAYSITTAFNYMDTLSINENARIVKIQSTIIVVLPH